MKIVIMIAVGIIKIGGTRIIVVRNRRQEKSGRRSAPVILRREDADSVTGNSE
jgi:hypothetical protein